MTLQIFLLLNLAFISWIFESIKHHFSLFIYTLFRNIWWILQFLLLFLITLNIILHKKSINSFRIILLNIFAFLVVYIFAFLPFKQGEKFYELRIIGFKLIECIESYKLNNWGKAPTEMRILYNNCIYDKDTIMIKQNFKYQLLEKDSISQNYFLELHPQDLEHSFYGYNNQTKEFVEMDDLNMS